MSENRILERIPLVANSCAGFQGTPSDTYFRSYKESDTCWKFFFVYDFQFNYFFFC
jgi:hypothetical protein